MACSFSCIGETMTKNEREILRLLREKYENYKTGLEFRNPFELVIATMLSAQVTDKQVNKVTKRLFEKYPTVYEMHILSIEEIEQEINSVGLYKNKSKHIKGICKKLLDDFGGIVPNNRHDLESLPGVGRKTANVVLCNAFNIPAFAVDTHVFRVSQRLGLAQGKTVAQVEETLMRKLPQKYWCGAHHWIIWHGREFCKARNPLCEECFLFTNCPKIGV